MHIEEVNIELMAQKIVNNEIDMKSLVDHYNECVFCKNKLEFFISFYKNFSEEYSNPADARTEEFAKKISTPRIIRLKYYQPEINKSYLEENKNILILAAETKTQDYSTPINVVKFASEPHKVLVRIVEDRNKNIYRLYILSENDEYRNQALVGISDGKGPVNFSVTDKNGCGIIQFTTIKDWQNVNVLLFIPVATFSIIKGIIKNETYKQDSIILNVSIDHEYLKFHISPNLENVNRLLIILADGNKILMDIIENKVSISSELAEKIREIKLY
jgi:hypothetical protein